MQNDRRAILSLVAVGRITPGEAERLLAAWNEGREVLWVFVVCACACLAQAPLHDLVAGLMPLAKTLLPAGSMALHYAISAFNQVSGGSL